MKNVIIISGVPLVWGNSAAVVRMNNYARALAANEGVRVYLFSQKFFKEDVGLIEIEKNIFTTPKPDKNNFRSFAQGWRFVGQINRIVRSFEGQCVYLFYPEPNPTIEVAFLLRNKILGRSKAFCEVNEVRKYASHLSEVALHKKIIERSFFWFSEQFIRIYDGVICISNHIEQYFSLKNKSSIVVPILSNIQEETEHTRTLSGDTIQFIFTGSVSVEKENLLELLKGFARFDEKNGNWEFLLYGYCNDFNSRKIQKVTADLRIESKVRLMGEVQQNEIQKILSQADCLILPRRNTMQNYYGFSTKLSEYAISGRPIILTNTGVVADYFQDGVDCLMTQGYDAEAFSESLDRFLSMSLAERNRMGKKAYETAKAHFNWRNYCKILNELLR